MSMFAIFNQRHRIWSLPLLAGAGWAATRFGIEGAAVDTMRVTMEAAVGCGSGLILAIFSNLLQDQARNAHSQMEENAQRLEKLELTYDKVEEVRAELIVLRDALKGFVSEKKRDTDKIRGHIVDLNNDISKLKDQDPSRELRPQLQLIAEKFGELAGVKQVVKSLSSKVKKVESLAEQVYEVESRISQVNSPQQVPEGWKNWYVKVQKEIASVHELIDSQVRQQVKSEVSRMLSVWRGSVEPQVVPAAASGQMESLQTTAESMRKPAAESDTSTRRTPAVLGEAISRAMESVSRRASAVVEAVSDRASAIINAAAGASSRKESTSSQSQSRSARRAEAESKKFSKRLEQIETNMNRLSQAVESLGNKLEEAVSRRMDAVISEAVATEIRKSQRLAAAGLPEARQPNLGDLAEVSEQTHNQLAHGDSNQPFTTSEALVGQLIQLNLKTRVEKPGAGSVAKVA